jgi:hypothetical protein
MNGGRLGRWIIEAEIKLTQVLYRIAILDNYGHESYAILIPISLIRTFLVFLLLRV